MNPTRFPKHSFATGAEARALPVAKELSRVLIALTDVVAARWLEEKDDPILSRAHFSLMSACISIIGLLAYGPFAVGYCTPYWTSTALIGEPEREHLRAKGYPHVNELLDRAVLLDENIRAILAGHQVEVPRRLRTPEDRREHLRSAFFIAVACTFIVLWTYAVTATLRHVKMNDLRRTVAVLILEQPVLFGLLALSRRVRKPKR